MAKLEPRRATSPTFRTCGTSRSAKTSTTGCGRHGWDVTVTPAEELMAGYDRRPPQDIEDAAPQTLFVTAERTEGNVSVARTDNDSWEITESVGATALGVASARAAETEARIR